MLFKNKNQTQILLHASKLIRTFKGQGLNLLFKSIPE